MELQRLSSNKWFLLAACAASFVVAQIAIPPFINLNCGCEGKLGKTCSDPELGCKPMITLGFYTDKNCQDNEIRKDFDGTESGGVHCGICNKDALDDVHQGDIWAKVLGGGDIVEAWVSDSHDCPTDDAPKPITKFRGGESDKCKPIKGVSNHWTVNVYGLGYGDGPTCKRSIGNSTLTKRDDAKCKKFIKGPTHTIKTPEQDISARRCCNEEGDCPFDKKVEDSVEFDVSFQLDGGGGVKGVDTDASLGFKYEKKREVSITDHHSVPHDQCAHLSWWCWATKYEGTFTECDGPDRPGTMVVPGNDCHESLTID